MHNAQLKTKTEDNAQIKAKTFCGDIDANVIKNTE